MNREPDAYEAPALPLSYDSEIVTSSPFKGLFFILGQQNFFIYIVASAQSQKARKNALNFAKFHTRGGRGLWQAHPRIGLPLPPAQSSAGGWRARRHTTGWLGARLSGGRTTGAQPARAATPARAAYTGQGGYPAGGYVRGATGRTWRGGYRGGRIPGGGATGANGAAVAPTWAATGRGATPAARAGYLCRGVYRAGYTGSAATPGGRRQAARRHSYPGGAATPAGYRAERWRSERAACDGYTPSEITVGGYPGGATGGRGAKKYFLPGRLPGAKSRRLPLTRIYKKPFLGRRGEDTF